MGNHTVRNGKIFQINKKISHLKKKQIEFMYDVMKNKYIKYVNLDNKYSLKLKEQILYEVYEEIQIKGIWISFIEFKKYFNSKFHKLHKNN